MKRMKFILFRLIFLITISYVHCTIGYQVLSYGLNNYFQTGIESPGGNSFDFIQFPSYLPQESNIIFRPSITHIIGVDQNTIIATNDSIYVLGSETYLSYMTNEQGYGKSPYPLRIVRNKNPILSMKCNRETCLLLNSDYELYGWGLNNYGILGGNHLGHFPVLYIRLLDKGVVDYGINRCSVMYINRNNEIYFSGMNCELSFGSERYDIDSITYDFLHMNETYNFPDSKMVKMNINGNFHSVEFENNEFYMWGCKECLTFTSGSSSPQIVPVYVNFTYGRWNAKSDIKKEDRILQFECNGNTCFVLVDEINKNNNNTLYSYGCTMLNFYLGRVSDIWDTGVPKQVSRNEIKDDENIITFIMGTNYEILLIITDYYNVYAFGNNNYFLINPDEQATSFLDFPERILSNYSVSYISQPSNHIMFVEKVSFSKCGNFWFDEPEVCGNGKGLCINDKCECYKVFFSGPNCQDFDMLIVLQNPLYIFLFIILPAMVLCVCIFVVFLLGFMITCLIKKRLRKYDLIKDDVDIILQEQLLERDVSVAHLKVNKSLYSIDFKDLKLKRVLKRECNGIAVYYGRWNHKEICFKSYLAKDFLTTQDEYNKLEKEISILMNVQFPFIVQSFGVVKVPRFGIVLEFCKNGNFEEFLKKFKKKNEISFPTIEKVRILKEVAGSLSYLNGLNILHRNVNLKSILVKKNYESRLSGFALSKLIVNNIQHQTRVIADPKFLAPEVFSNCQYNEKCDVYSFALTIYISISERYDPYSFGLGESNIGLETKILGDKNYRPTVVKEHFTGFKWLKDLMIKCWDYTNENRYTFQMILNEFNSNYHPIIKEDFEEDYNVNLQSCLEEELENILRVKTILLKNISTLQ